MKHIVDYVIVGGGSAGSATAKGLSVDPAGVSPLQSVNVPFYRHGVKN